MFERSFSFEGRIRRTEYGISLIIYVVVATILNGVIESNYEEADILVIAFIPLLWFFWAQGAKRCHDLGNSGWWQLVPLYFLWLLFQDGQRYTNSYGTNPKGLGIYIDEEIPVKNEETAQQPPIVEENHTIGTTLLEIKNASYGNTQDILKQLRNVASVNQLSLEYIDTVGKVTVGHRGSSQQLLEELLSVSSPVEVEQIINGHIIIKL